MNTMIKVQFEVDGHITSLIPLFSVMEITLAEVASLGGFERQYQIVIDPDRLAGFGLTVADITRAVREFVAEVKGPR